MGQFAVLTNRLTPTLAGSVFVHVAPVGVLAFKASTTFGVPTSAAVLVALLVRHVGFLLFRSNPGGSVQFDPISLIRTHWQSLGGHLP